MDHLIGKQIAKIEVEEMDATYCNHVDSYEYRVLRQGSRKYQIPTDLLITFTDGTTLSVSADRLGEVYREEGASYLCISG